MSLIVQKFGGSSVRDYAHLLRMARIVKSRVDEGDDVVVVLSAQGDTTDGLLQKAKEISERPSPRELDMLLSAGEQMSAALGAMTLRSIGVEAVSLCAWQIPIETDGTHGNAEIELIDTARIRKELAEGYVTRLALNKDKEIIGYEFIHLGKMMDFIKNGMTPAEAMDKATGTYGQFDEAAQYIDPRKE